jgi:Cu/Ag efflux pump CusA
MKIHLQDNFECHVRTQEHLSELIRVLLTCRCCALGDRAFNIIVILDRPSRQSLSGKDITSFVEQAKAQIAKITLSSGTYVTLGGAVEAQAQSQRERLLNSLFAAVGIVLLVSVVTRDTNNLRLVLVNLPFPIVAGLIAVFAMGGLLSLGSMVRFITLFGITLRNSILMIAHYEHLVAIEGELWNLATAIRGAADRLTPILMTSIVTALGVLLLAIQMAEPGQEVEGPMAVVILGGLFTSMVLKPLGTAHACPSLWPI